MARTFNGRVVQGGRTSGRCVTRKEGFNALDTFLGDQSSISGRILCLPVVVGSTTGGMIMQATIESGNAPNAMLFSEHIDPLAAAGILLAKYWNNKELIAIDQLGDEFLDYVRDGQSIDVYDDGRVVVN